MVEVAFSESFSGLREINNGYGQRRPERSVCVEYEGSISGHFVYHILGVGDFLRVG